MHGFLCRLKTTVPAVNYFGEFEKIHRCCPEDSYNGACSSGWPSWPPAANLLSSQINLYDNQHTTWFSEPTSGKPTGQRTFLYWGDPTEYDDARYQAVNYTYDTWGNRASVTTFEADEGYGAPLTSGGQTSYITYDSVYHTYPVLSVNPDGQATVIAYDYALGLPTAEAAPNGAVTKGYYDAYGRLTKVEQYKDTTTYATTNFSYNIPETPSSTIPFWTEATQTGDAGLNVKVRKFYTGLGQLIQTQSVGVTLDSGANRTVVVDTQYDAAGRAWKHSAPYDIATPTGYYPPDWGQGYSTSAYDVLGRPVLATATDGVTTAYSYTITTTNGVLSAETCLTPAGHVQRLC